MIYVLGEVDQRGVTWLGQKHYQWERPRKDVQLFLKTMGNSAAVKLNAGAKNIRHLF